jgi:nucleotidyltransferase substrate binding protein (TIGR01987 family)
MTEPQDIRWKQRFQNFGKALQTLRLASDLSAQRPLSELERQGLIQGFEFTHELAWNVLKDFLEAQGYVGLIGSRNATREAFKAGLLEDGQVWMDMIQARNQTSHTYNLDLAEEVAREILARYYPAFLAMAARFESLSREQP